MAEHFLGNIAVKAIIPHEGRVLICRDGKDASIWEIPGGRLHVDEDIEDALLREVREELGQEARVGALIYSEPFHHTRDGLQSMLLAYETHIAHPEQPLMIASDEIAEVKWITEQELGDQQIYPNCLNALKAYFAIRK